MAQDVASLIEGAKVHATLLECVMPLGSDTSADDPGNELDPAAYDHWFRAKVQEGMTSARPRMLHADAVAKVALLLGERPWRVVHVDNLTDAEADVYIEAFSLPPTDGPQR